jgi:hypothetical protein
VANFYNNTVGEYTSSGATVNASLISGLDLPTGIAISPASAVLPPPPVLTLQSWNGYPLLTLQGTLGDTYTIQYTTNLAAPNWTPMVVVPNLPVSPYQMIDPAGVGQTARFYRALQQ